jgi:hypothetical protein
LDLFLVLATKDGAMLLRAIAAAGVDVNVAGPKGKTLLLLAVELASICDYKLRRRMMAGICCLLDHGADPNLANDMGETGHGCLCGQSRRRFACNRAGGNGDRLVRPDQQ